MTLYTGVADANGDFTIPFSTEYTAGQKITVTAEKDSAIKTIELYAPSDASGGGIIQFSGTMNNFPDNIGNVTLSSEINEDIPQGSFNVANSGSIWGKATGLSIKNATNLGQSSFSNWVNALELSLPTTLITIGNSAFDNWHLLREINIPNGVTFIDDYAFRNCFACLKIIIGSAVTSIGWNAFDGAVSCNELISLANTPPVAGSYFLDGLKSTCVIKVPAASLDAYKSATNWSAFASKIQAI